jgi:hypothetical protein
VVSFTLLPLSVWRCNTGTRRLGGLQCLSGGYGEEKKLRPAGNLTPDFQPVAMPEELSQLLLNNNTKR